ncbi:MAG: hypothetical protein LUH11_01870 [Candidatus Gastranaerophilales bacterium]|nr:hypothetical protein [Candidatus Gastranaerophilales bacterium]
MSYKNDSYLVISNKYSGLSSDASAMLFETYDLLRDITVSGSASDGAGFGTAGSFLWKLASMIAPSSFMSTMGGGTSINIPGTSYWTSSSSTSSTNSSFGLGSLSSYSGFTGGASSLITGFGTASDSGYLTGGASALTSVSDIAGSTGINALTYTAGLASGFGFGDSFLLPAAGVVSGFGGILQAMSPYLGAFGLSTTLVGNLLQGCSSAPLAAYQKVSSSILNNADVILENKIKNIETVVKMLDAQNDVVKKMLKDDMDNMKDKINDLT